MIQALKLCVFYLLCALPLTGAFDYKIDEESGLGFFVTDVSTGIDNVRSLHNGFEVSVEVTGIGWVASENATDNSMITYTTYVDGEFSSSGTYDLSADGKSLPSSLEVGVFSVDSSGRHTFTLELELDGVTTTVEDSVQSFTSASAIVPLIIVLLLSIVTQSVELSLTFAIFVGACMLTGNVEDGFFRTLDTFILESVADINHGFVFLFTFFLSGLVGMMQKSGGFGGFTETVSKFATSSRAGQFTSFFSGCVIFFDDYANTLIVGESMRPLTDLLSISREKLAFLVDGTSAPIASITPISAWIGFELGLIQDEIDKLVDLNGEDSLTITTSALSLFLESVKFRYYPIFMLMFLPTLIATKRDYGPMLVAERKVQVYARQDGGDGKASGETLGEQANSPEPDTPKSIWNMLVPLAVLIVLIVWLLVKSGEIEGEEQSFLEKMENADSYVALLYGSMAAALITLLFYHVQFKQDGSELLLPTPKVLGQYFKGWFKKADDDDESSTVRPVMSVSESVTAFLHGMGHVFPAAIVLTLAWATGAMTQAVGTDRLFATWISDSVDYRALPTLSFIISLFMALATGTSWGTMAIMFPLIFGVSYDVSNGSPLIVYATTAGILSGAVAGDHVSPISDTTVLSSLATDCDLLRHVLTQAPYVLWICIFSVLFGTLPVSYSGYPNGIAYLLGYIMIALFILFMCRPVISKTGSYDPLTELILRFKPNDELLELKEATREAYETTTMKDGGEKKGIMSAFIKKEKPESTEDAVKEKEVAKEEEKPIDSEDEEEAEVDSDDNDPLTSPSGHKFAQNQESMEMET